MRCSTSPSMPATRCPTAARSRSPPAERGPRGEGAIRPGGDRGRRLYRRLRRRYRRRHVAGDPGEGLRSVLHHQADRPGHRPWPVDDLRLRQAIARTRADRKRRGQGHDRSGCICRGIKGDVEHASRGADPRCRHGRRRDRAGRRGRFGRPPDHLRRAARPGLCLHRSRRRPGGAADADLQHAARPADHRCRPSRPERPPARRNRAPASARPEDPVRHRLCRARHGPRAVPRRLAWRW